VVTKSKIVVIATVAALGYAEPVFAQSFAPLNNKACLIQINA
jgi:hypothetical protein